jgi:AbrB family looped-hinge helix DNA binding protein
VLQHQAYGALFHFRGILLHFSLHGSTFSFVRASGKPRTVQNTTVTLDKAGRVVIPKTLREELHLSPGDRLELQSEGDQVTLRPVRAHSPMQKKQGFWVFRNGAKLSNEDVNAVMSKLRQQR